MGGRERSGGGRKQFETLWGEVAVVVAVVSVVRQVGSSEGAFRPLRWSWREAIGNAATNL